MDEENSSDGQEKNLSSKEAIDNKSHLTGTSDVEDKINSQHGNTSDTKIISVGLAEATYRCEQVNVTKVDGIVVSNSKQKFQFKVKLNIADNKAYILLEDHYYDITPPVLNKILIL